MRNHRVATIVLAIIIFVLVWHLLTILMSNLTMLILIGLVGAGCRYWGTRIGPADDLHRLRSWAQQRRQVGPPD